MSQPLIAARNAPVRQLKTSAEARPELQVVTPPAVRRLRLPLPVACVVLLTLGLLGLLMTNIAIAGDAYRITDLQVQSQRLANQQQAAAESLAQQSSPEQLAQRAAQLGMVAAPDAVHLTGSGVVGEATPAPKPSASPAASQAQTPAR
ncbi:hypothetical protein [Kineococcus rhizosphaerae]|uniref:Cell division protein FtsL n=1 Tax=Kineococcus rhizosphaerae TaxID=559628 RepID=A0A2T0R8R1_9ACTN|nr:hypothetical protein [Kineococcus rhizosphaerae]PRY17530.1 hypothetical protein CLV37_102493 [Kineococcus rhizosphaerae]